jgi:hypothetical protein
MRFIGQVALDARLFGRIDGRMAYLFMTDDEEDVDGTWKPDGGENAVIIQPGDLLVPVREIAEGPTLYRMASGCGNNLAQEACEFLVRLAEDEDPEFVPEGDRWRGDWALMEAYHKKLVGNKLGGTPGFLQGDEFPGDEFHRLLLQLDSTRVPFWINFGDCGIGYAFLSRSGRSGKFLWQCC